MREVSILLLEREMIQRFSLRKEFFKKELLLTSFPAKSMTNSQSKCVCERERMSEGKDEMRHWKGEEDVLSQGRASVIPK